eukprot:scaffold9676_cov200-Amphora_coffeaeformis.AAC.3
MQPDDIAMLVDSDEIFTQDFLRALQTCEVPALNYDSHQCLPKNLEIPAYTQAFESSPECVAFNFRGFHPDIIIGACLEGVGNVTKNVIAPRAQPHGILRKPGWDTLNRTDMPILDFLVVIRVCENNHYDGSPQAFQIRYCMFKERIGLCAASVKSTNASLMTPEASSDDYFNTAKDRSGIRDVTRQGTRDIGPVGFTPTRAAKETGSQTDLAVSDPRAV